MGDAIQQFYESCFAGVEQPCLVAPGRRGRRRLFTDEQEMAIARAYQDGQSTASISAERRIAMSTVVNILNRRGVEFRAPNTRPPSDRDEEIVQLIKDGKGGAEVSRMFNITRERVRQIAAQHGLILGSYKQELKEIEDAQIATKYLAGKRPVELSGMFNRALSGINKLLREHPISAETYAQTTARPKRRSRHAALVPAMAEAYRLGATCQEIADRYGIKHAAQVHRLLARHGVVLRRPGTYSRAPTPQGEG